jgi:hypothetical protein
MCPNTILQSVSQKSVYVNVLKQIIESGGGTDVVYGFSIVSSNTHRRHWSCGILHNILVEVMV